MIQSVDEEESTFLPPPHRFEATCTPFQSQKSSASAKR